MMVNKKIDTDVAKTMLSGKSDALISSFYLNYNMIINLMRVEGVNPEYIVKRSFHQFQSERAVPQIKQKLQEFRNKLEEYSFDNEDELKDILSCQSQIEKYTEDITKIITKPENILPFLIPGRLMKVKGFGWGICVNFTKKMVEVNFKSQKNQEIFMKQNDKDQSTKTSNYSDKTIEMIFVDILLYVNNVVNPDMKLQPGQVELMNGQLGVVPVVLTSIENISPIKVNIPHDLKDKKNLKHTEKIYLEILKRHNKNNKLALPLMDPIKEMGIEDNKLEDLMSKQSSIEETLKSFGTVSIEDIEKFKEKENIRKNMTSLMDNITKFKELVLKDDLKNMKRVLRRLDFINKDTILSKGQVACLISSADEILLTEMMFNGSFNDIEPDLLCAMLSCFMVNENSKSETKALKNANLQALFKKCEENAMRVADVLIECKININKNYYVWTIKCDLIENKLAWANGDKIYEI
jgi:ATP-dependent RNA helicase DOB1